MSLIEELTAAAARAARPAEDPAAALGRAERWLVRFVRRATRPDRRHRLRAVVEGHLVEVRDYCGGTALRLRPAGARRWTYTQVSVAPDAGPPCAECRRPMTDADRDDYEANAGYAAGWPRCCGACAEAR